MLDNLDDYRFITEDKTFAINLITGETVDDPKTLRAINKVGHHSLEWRGALEKHRELVDRVLSIVDHKIVETATTYTFEHNRADDTAQEIRLMVTDIVLKNTHLEHEALIDFVRSCINNFARRVFSAITRENKHAPHYRAFPLESVPTLHSNVQSPEFFNMSDLSYYVSNPMYKHLDANSYDPLKEIQWNELKDEVRQHLTRIQQRVFDLVVENPDMTEAEIAEELGYADQSGVSHIRIRIRNKVTELVESGILELY